MKFSKSLTATILCLLLTGIVLSQEKKIYWGSDVPTGWSGTWPEKLLTPAERSDYTKTASNDEILKFISMLKWNSENIYVVPGRCRQPAPRWDVRTQWGIDMSGLEAL